MDDLSITINVNIKDGKSDVTVIQDPPGEPIPQTFDEDEKVENDNLPEGIEDIINPHIRKSKFGRIYNWRPDRPDHRDKYMFNGKYMFNDKKKKIINLPTVIDLSPAMPEEIFDQGILGSCTANAASAAISYLDKLNGPYDVYSRLFIYWNTRYLEGSVGEDAGAIIRNTIRSVAHWGAAVETQWPYIISRFKDRPPDTAYKDALKHKTIAYYRVRQTLQEMRAALASGYPIIFGFSVFDSFEIDAVTKGGQMIMPLQNETSLGGHAVLAVGYNDETKKFKIRNSWGAGWGDKGYFYMPYDYLLNDDLAEDFWVIQRVLGI